MAYSRHTWASGDVVSAARLNNIEDGIEGGFLVKHTVADNTLGCSYNDLLAEINAGKLPYLYTEADYPYTPITRLYEDKGGYYVAEFAFATFTASDPDDPMEYTVDEYV